MTFADDFPKFLWTFPYEYTVEIVGWSCSGGVCPADGTYTLVNATACDRFPACDGGDVLATNFNTIWGICHTTGTCKVDIRLTWGASFINVQVGTVKTGVGQSFAQYRCATADFDPWGTSTFSYLSKAESAGIVCTYPATVTVNFASFPTP